MSLASEKFHQREKNGDNSMSSSTLISASDFIAFLETHDWHFKDYDKALKSQKRLLYLCQEQPELFRLYNHAENCILRSLPFNFPSVVGTTPVKDETPHTQTTTPMKELLQSIFEALIKPLIDAIDRNTASKGNVGYAPEAAPPATPPPAPVVEKPVKAAKAPKAAPAPAPEPEAPEEAAEPISETRLKATVKTLPDADKLKLKAYFQTTFGYNTMAEIAEENRNAIHAKAISLGATDTDPDSLGDM
jgi:hypothetical protein